MRPGVICGVGVGPGDPGLLTVRAVEALRGADAVVAPAPRRSGQSLALSIARPHLPEDCIVRTTHLPMTEDPRRLTTAWDEAAAMLLRLAAAARSVVFITLGDAMLYSTWSYVLTAVLHLDPDADVRTIPGVTAMSACAALVRQPLGEGRDPLLVWPDEPPANVAALLDLAPNIVFMKAGGHLQELAEAAELAGAEAVAVTRASQAEARVTRDLRAAAGERDYFTTVLMRRPGADASGDELRPAWREKEAGA
jgi:precorrin-2/cobalt-factor-2 C20-methyltransferase